MVKTLVVLVSTLVSIASSAEVYTNKDGCTLKVTSTEETVTYELAHKGLKEKVVFSSDYMEVDFKYCPNKSGDIFFTEGSVGYGLMVFCDDNPKATLRGVVDLEVKNSGKINSFSVLSERKGITGEWVEDSNLSCSNFL